MGNRPVRIDGQNTPIQGPDGMVSLVASCEARGINPFAYLADVIPRVQDHPKRRLDELLPGPWSRARAET